MLIVLLDEPGLFVFPTAADAEVRIEAIDAESLIRAAFDNRAVPYRIEWVRPNRRGKYLGLLSWVENGAYHFVPAGPPDPHALARLIEDYPDFTDPPEAKPDLLALLASLRTNG